MPKGIGYGKKKGRKQRGGNAGSGKTTVKNYDPATTDSGGGGKKPSVVGKYKPAGKVRGRRK